MRITLGNLLDLSPYSVSDFGENDFMLQWNNAFKSPVERYDPNEARINTALSRWANARNAGFGRSSVFW